MLTGGRSNTFVHDHATKKPSRIVQSYRALLNLRDYLAINEMEGHGFDRAEARWFITGKFAWELSGPA